MAVDEGKPTSNFQALSTLWSSTRVKLGQPGTVFFQQGFKHAQLIEHDGLILTRRFHGIGIHQSNKRRRGKRGGGGSERDYGVSIPQGEGPHARTGQSLQH